MKLHSRDRSSGAARTGRAGAGLLLGLLLVIGAVLAVLFVVLGGQPTGESGRTTRDTEPAPAAPITRAEIEAAPKEAVVPTTTESRNSSHGSTLVVEAFERGTPWSGAFELWLEHVPRPGSRQLRAGEFVRATSGSLRVEGLAPGDYRGFARAAGRRSGEFRVDITPTRAEERTRVDLDLAGVVRGRLTNGSAGLDGLAVRMRSAGSAHVDASRTDMDGRFEFLHVLGGEHVLEIGPRFDPIVKDWTIEMRGVELDLGDRVLEGLTQLSIRVVDAAGRPVSGARVHDGAMSGHFDLVTDEQGSATARHLPMRQYRVFAEHAVLGTKNLPIRIETAEPARIELALPR